MDGQKDLGQSQLTSQQRAEPQIQTLQQRGIWNVRVLKTTSEMPGVHGNGANLFSKHRSDQWDLHSFWGGLHSTCAAPPGNVTGSSDVPTTALWSRNKLSLQTPPGLWLQADSEEEWISRSWNGHPCSWGLTGQGVTETQPFTAQWVCTSGTWNCSLGNLGSGGWIKNPGNFFPSVCDGQV